MLFLNKEAAEKFVQEVVHWPNLSVSQRWALVIAGLIAITNILLLFRAGVWGRKALNQAVALLKMQASALIQSKSNMPTKARSLSARLERQTIRDLADKIQEITQCPVITDRMAQEALREVSLPSKVKGIATPEIDAVLKEFDATEKHPSSIAFTNRIYAYILCMVGVILACFQLQFVTTRADSMIAAWGFWACLVLQVWIGLTIPRATAHWKRVINRVQKDGLRGRAVRGPHVLIDFPVYWIVNSPIAGVLMAALWEGLLWIVVPMQCVPLLMGYATVQITNVLDVNRASLESLLRKEAGIIQVLWILIAFYVLINTHRYKFFETRRLRRRLQDLDRELKIAELEGSDIALLMEGYITTARQLWVIDGTPCHRSLENLASKLADDGEYKVADALYKESFEIANVSQGVEGRDIAGILRNHARLMYCQNRIADGRRLESLADRIDFGT